jgi:hypothetical protein|eukprot:TRINITY_DN266_c0_g2_i1.p2 TRINITY_DN266_c0_g2~~TRINITY_DN266_c0_g2_i1.p2  ORF type:complete len:157 (-),score=71.64 TRINITY_DN266_c0_g2_i1:137-607(-)
MGRGSISKTNPNTSFLQSPRLAAGFLLLYLSLTLLVWWVLFMAGFGPSAAWSLTLLVHTLATFYAFHWAKGVPFPLHDAARYRGLTFWEQMHAEDAGWAAVKKALSVAPIALFAVALHYSYYDFPRTMGNLVSLGFCLVPKMEALHKKRILGINAE